jgi:DNA-directed RNA polymerase subunit RPC12/RpoP
MGQGITLKCGKCKHIQKYLTGVGFLDIERLSNLTDILKDVHSRSRDKIQKFLKTNKILKKSFSNELFQCHNCDKIYLRFYYKLVSTNNDVLEAAFRCSNCKKRLKMIPDLSKIDSASCNKCGSRTLKVKEMILWD